MPAEAFMNELINSIRRERMGEFKDKFRRVDTLILDDVQFLAGRERTQEEFFHTFNALHSERHEIILTSDKVPREIPGLEERLRKPLRIRSDRRYCGARFGKPASRFCKRRPHSKVSLCRARLQCTSRRTIVRTCASWKDV
jgi:hypothetical protein